MKARRLTLVGAGLAGALLATLLARRGFEVEVFERYPDPRRATVPAGRSINLALAERGRAALAEADLLEGVGDFALPMAGRMLHEPDQPPRLQRYSQHPDEVIYSVHRGHLNRYLLDAAEAAGARLVFDQPLVAVDFPQRLARFGHTGETRQHGFEVLIGSDGAGSALRQAIAEETELGLREVPLDHGYKELTIAPVDGAHAIEPEALHIWPRGGFMMIALPNPDASFTCTLFLENHGRPGFDSIAETDDGMAFLAAEFPDALALMPNARDELAGNPVGFLGTLYLDCWRLDGRAVLLGDAAHAIVPFHGQGMNAAFEDCVSLARHLSEHNDCDAAFAAFEAERKPNADAIAAMALDNYEEMRASVRDPRFHLKKELEWWLERELPERFVPRYSMVMFRPDIPYAEARRRGEIQARLLDAHTAKAESLDQVDYQALRQEVMAVLKPLPIRS